MSRFAQPRRRLIVDTDLGLDDLVALTILRLQQCLISTHQGLNLRKNSNANHRHTNFELCGVTLTSGISTANSKNAALLRRILSPGTPVYVGATCKTLSWNGGNDIEKPIWWTRTADRVANFLSSLPALETTQQQTRSISAEEYISQNLDNPEVDILCMAPLSNVAKAIDLFQKRNPDSPICAQVYIMGGIRNDSKWTMRSESTAPFGYRDLFAENEKTIGEDCNHTTDHFGEFNFALDIHSARDLLAAVPSNIITLEACTLIPLKLRDCKLSTNLASVLARSQEVKVKSNTAGKFDTYDDLNISRRILLQLLKEFGTDETQWDSISAAIYCNAFQRGTKQMRVKQSELIILDLGVLVLNEPCQVASGNPSCDASNSHMLYPAFTVEDEMVFYDFLSSILFG